MEFNKASSALGALAQPTRLGAFRLLVQKEPEGLAAGDIARILSVPANTLSAHLATLTHEGLVRAERRGRSIIYRAQIDRLRELILFLVQDCCGGREDLCAPLVQELVGC